MSLIVGVNGIQGGLQITGADYTNGTLSDSFLEMLTSMYQTANVQKGGSSITQTDLQAFQTQLNELINLGQNGLSVQLTNGPNVTYYYTTSQVQVLSQLVQTLQAAGVTDLSNITLPQLQNWVNTAQGSTQSSANIANIFLLATNLLTQSTISGSAIPLVGSSQLNHVFDNGTTPVVDPTSLQSFQSVTEIDFVETANQVLTSSLQNLQDALQTTQNVLASLTSLQDLHNEVQVVSRTFNFQYYGAFLTGNDGPNPGGSTASAQANTYATQYTSAASGQLGTPVIPQLSFEATPYSYSAQLTPLVVSYNPNNGYIRVGFYATSQAAANELYLVSPKTGVVANVPYIPNGGANGGNTPQVTGFTFQLTTNDNADVGQANSLNTTSGNLYYSLGDTNGNLNVLVGDYLIANLSANQNLNATYNALYGSLVNAGYTYHNSKTYAPAIIALMQNENLSTNAAVQIGGPQNLLAQILNSGLQIALGASSVAKTTLEGYYYADSGAIGNFLVGTVSGMKSLELQMLQIQSTLTAQVAFLKLSTQTPMSTQNNPTLLQQSLLGTTETVLANLNSGLAYFDPSSPYYSHTEIDNIPGGETYLSGYLHFDEDGGSYSNYIGFPNLATQSIQSFTIARNWVLDNYQNFDSPSAANAGALQQNITSAITAAESQNSTQQQNVTNLLYVFQEYYTSASAVLTALSQMITKMAQNISN